ncbi:MAG: S8 family serine peptidase [Deltaproteobacteria bacterium]
MLRGGPIPILLGLVLVGDAQAQEFVGPQGTTGPVGSGSFGAGSFGAGSVSTLDTYVPRLGPGLAARIRRDGLDARQRFIAKGLDAAAIVDAGGRITGRFGDAIVTGVLDGRALVALAPSSVRIEAPRALRPALDKSREAIGADTVDYGTLFDRSYRGAGALIGVYDTGVDLTHPDLREVDGPSRVVGLWDQSVGGAPPPGQTFGDNCDTEELAEDRCGHLDVIGHGTLVSAIAASNGPLYRGVAPEAKLAVATSTAFDTVLESLAWFSQVAADQELPLVVNISLAGQEGPHDGTSLHAQAIDAYDHLVVAAAGNEGALPVHALARLEKGDITNVALDFPVLPERARRQAIVDIWGDVGPEVSAQVQVWSADQEILAETATIAPGDPGRTVVLLGEGRSFGVVDLDTDDPLDVENRQGHIRIALRLDDWEDAPDGPGYLVIRLRGEGRIDLWVDSPVSEPSPIRFDRDRVLGVDEQTLGDTDHTISDLATAISALSVSAYVTRTEFVTEDGTERSVSGTLGKVAPFSSWGPTLAESRTGKKPDIAAPGHLVIGARSRSAGPDAGAVSPLYRAAAGTSMAAPHVAGVAALILGARPEVSKTDLKSFILGGAVQDGDADPQLDPRWGAGRLDATLALMNAVGAQEGGCGCHTTGGRSGVFWAVFVVLAWGLSRRR